MKKKGRKKKPLDKQKEGKKTDARVWQRPDPAGGVYCGVADGGGVRRASDPYTSDRAERKGHTEQELADAPQFVRDGLAALRRAAAMAREIAIQTDTGIVVVRDGKIVLITAEELRKDEA